MLKLFSASLLLASAFAAMPALAEINNQPSRNEVCNYIGQYDAEDAVFDINGRVFHDGDFDYPISGDTQHWYVEATNLKTKQGFYCSCLNLSSGNECTPTN